MIKAFAILLSVLASTTNAVTNPKFKSSVPSKSSIPSKSSAPSKAPVAKSAFANSLGAQAPLGKIVHHYATTNTNAYFYVYTRVKGFFDPLGLLVDADQERFDRLREVELKHGRIAMLAVAGHITTTSGYHLPGDVAFGVPFSSVICNSIRIQKLRKLTNGSTGK